MQLHQRLLELLHGLARRCGQLTPGELPLAGTGRRAYLLQRAQHRRGQPAAQRGGLARTDAGAAQ